MGRRGRMGGRLRLLMLAALLALAGCGRPAAPQGRVVIFVLDSPIDADFVEGREAGRPASMIGHGSLVGRVIRRYCSADLVSIPVEEADGAVSHQAYLSGLRQVLAYAAAHPRDRMIANVSLGSPAADPEERDLVRRVIDAGVLVVAAAGNEDSERPDYPAGYPGVVAVANASPAGKAASSNYGAYVSIAASGDITFIDYQFLPYERLRREMDARGTSFAAPRVAAAVAWVMARRPALSPQAAYGLVRDAADPIEDDYFHRGLLGAGLLDMARLRVLATPGFRFLHFVLPVIVWVLLGILSAWLCVRHGLPGLFLSLIIWLVALPTTVLFLVGLGPFGAVLLGLALVAAAAAWLEGRRVLAAARLGSGPIGGGTKRLLRAYRWSFDARVRAAAVVALGRTSDAEAVRFLLAEKQYPHAAVHALAEQARREPTLLRDWLERYDELPERQRERLTDALLRAADARVTALVEEVYAQRPSSEIMRLLEALNGRAT
jgi:hypothetical protein